MVVLEPFEKKSSKTFNRVSVRLTLKPPPTPQYFHLNIEYFQLNIEYFQLDIQYSIFNSIFYIQNIPLPHPQTASNASILPMDIQLNIQFNIL